MSDAKTSSEANLDFERHLELKQIAPVSGAFLLWNHLVWNLFSAEDLIGVHQDVFENVHQPWLFHLTFTVPGPLMMAQAAAAAYKSVPEGFMLDSLQTHFILQPDSKKPLVYKVQRLSQGRRFAIRLVTLQQAEKVLVSITISFVSGLNWTGRAMTHAVPMKIERRVQEIKLDDFETSRTHLGPFMKFERLPLVYEGMI